VSRLKEARGDNKEDDNYGNGKETKGR